MGRKHDRVTFKPYTMQQPSLLPPSLDELIPQDHLVRVVNRAIDALDLQPLLARYKGGGTSSYHPQMMLKVLVYAHTQRLYSSRQIAKALRENIHFMWLSGRNQPDFRTLNDFRSKTMKPVLDQVFGAVVEYLVCTALPFLRWTSLSRHDMGQEKGGLFSVWNGNGGRCRRCFFMGHRVSATFLVSRDS